MMLLYQYLMKRRFKIFLGAREGFVLEKWNEKDYLF